MPFQRLYATVNERIVQSLQMFRQRYTLRSLNIDGVLWEYLLVGNADQTVLFLHGMVGAYDIWWRQIEALQDRYCVLSVTYPAAQHLEALCRGIMAILAQEHISVVSVIGTSMGGYLAQYLLTRHPERIQRALLGNTFPPNEIIAHNTRWIGRLLPFLPAWVIIRGFRRSMHATVYPTSEGSELVRAYLLEQTYGMMSKAQFVGRYYCLIEPFTPPVPQHLGIPITIIEADNDPLLDKELRERLKTTYAIARLHTLHGVGHFPYLNAPAVYTSLIERFLTDGPA